MNRIVSALTVGLLSSQALIYSTWNQPPDLVSNPTISAWSISGPVLRVNPQGNALAVWPTVPDTEPYFETQIVSAYYVRGFGWQPQTTISSLALNEFDKPLYTAQGDPGLDFNSTGYAVSAWEGEYSTGNFANVIIATVRNSSGYWEPVQVIADDSGDWFNTDPSVSLNEAGTALVVWTAENLDTFRDHTTVSFLPFGGSWTAPFNFPGDAGQPQGNSKPYGDIDPSGNAAVVWVARDVNDQTFWHISAATYNAGTDTWTPPVNLDTFQGNIFQLTPRVAMDAAGHAVAVWTADEDAGSVAKAAYFNGTLWEAAITLGPSDEAAVFSGADVVMDLSGNATAVWGGPFPEYVIYASSRLPNGTWTAPQVISTPGLENTFAPFMSQEPLAVNPEGDVIATWVEFGSEIVKSAFKPFEQDWRAPETVFNGGDEGHFLYLNIGLASCGFAVDLWWQQGEDDVDFIYATENENLLLLQNPTAIRCKHSSAAQKRNLNILTWASDPCALSYNVYCNGVFVANVPNDAEIIKYVDALPCKNQCSNYTVTIVNIYGFEGDPVPVAFN